MVYISKMVIRNFKSFGGEPIKLSFQKGFNVITGPNGSGKSNIIDAVQFVLGELGSRRMRAGELSELIYDGAGEDHAGRAQVTEVKLYLDNSDKGLPSERKTVIIGRKMDREGKSVYLLNGQRTSRKRVVDMLEMAGITAGGYNIVLQGTATRLSDLTPVERMNALEDLVGIKEFDQKKAEAKVKLSEAERKIEVAMAQIQEKKKQVDELEEQRNNAILAGMLEEEERRLRALITSWEIKGLEEKLGDCERKLEAVRNEIKGLEEEGRRLSEEKKEVERRLDKFNRETIEERGTKLPLLRSDLAAKQSLRASLENRLRELNERKGSLQRSLEERRRELAQTRAEIESKRQKLAELRESKAKLEEKLEAKKEESERLVEQIEGIRKTAERNQARIEELSESLLPMQESLTGIETEINLHRLAVENLEEKMVSSVERRKQYLERRRGLEEKIVEYQALKQAEAEKLEEMIQALENQVRKQKAIRTTIENANKLAKEAETTITELSAKRELWSRIGYEEAALERVKEIGEAGAMEGYHGPLRSLIKVDLPHQRAVESSSNGWVKAVVIEDFETAKELIERLKKRRLGVIRFIPLNNLKAPTPLPSLSGKGIIGPIPEVIRFEERYAPAVYMVWGDTYLVRDPEAAELVVKQGFRAVTLGGDVFEPHGGVLGGYFRRPPDYKKLIPSEDSIKNLSKTIKGLRKRLSERMKELRSSGVDLRKFTEFIDDNRQRVEKIEEDIKATNESIGRLDRNLRELEEGLKKLEGEKEKELNLIQTLEERKQNILGQLEAAKEEISALREVKLSDIPRLERERDRVEAEASAIQAELNRVEGESGILSNLLERVLSNKESELARVLVGLEEDLGRTVGELGEVEAQLVEVKSEIEELEKLFNDALSEVQSNTSFYDQLQKSLNQFERSIERNVRLLREAERKQGQINVEKERLRLQVEKKIEELASLGFGDVVPCEGYLIEQLERRLSEVVREKRSLGRINQLAIENYDIAMRDYKEKGLRINDLEKEKHSILEFIEEVEQEKLDHFMKAYNVICENFSEVFNKLTGGGDGRLELQKPEDPFSGGVELYIQFPGKPIRQASGASGGERSVAAIAYLLAIQQFLKAPFYLFDEIDAHLDDLNTTRLAEVLRENAAESQFLMVSLKDVMVHSADQIYGVFSQNGRSRVLKLPIRREAELRV